MGIYATISLMKQDFGMKIFKLHKPFSVWTISIVRFIASPYSWSFQGSWGFRSSCSSWLLLSKMRRALFFWIGVGFLSVILTACAGGGASDSGDNGSGDNRSMDNGSMGDGPDGNLSMGGGLGGNGSMDGDSGGNVSRGGG